jgi:hypothetical protein
MEYIVFRNKQGTFLARLSADDLTISQEEVDTAKALLCVQHNIDFDDIELTFEETISFEDCETYINEEGKLMFKGVASNKEIDGSKGLINIFKEEGMEVFLSKYRGSLEQISEFTLSRTERRKDAGDFFSNDF